MTLVTRDGEVLSDSTWDGEHYESEEPGDAERATLGDIARKLAERRNGNGDNSQST